jgi:hypothetical protein
MRVIMRGERELKVKLKLEKKEITNKFHGFQTKCNAMDFKSKLN